MRIYVPYIHYITIFIITYSSKSKLGSKDQLLTICGPYFSKTLLTEKLHTVAARLTFIVEYGVIYVIYGVIYVLCIILEVYKVHITDLHKICQQSGFLVKTFHIPLFHM